MPARSPGYYFFFAAQVFRHTAGKENHRESIRDCVVRTGSGDLCACEHSWQPNPPCGSSIGPSLRENADASLLLQFERSAAQVFCLQNLSTFPLLAHSPATIPVFFFPRETGRLTAFLHPVRCGILFRKRYSTVRPVPAGSPGKNRNRKTIYLRPAGQFASAYPTLQRPVEFAGFRGQLRYRRRRCLPTPALPQL